MLALEHWREAAATSLRHRTRSLVAALSMSWGMFMLVVLLGVSTAVKDGARSMFKDDATNSLWVYPGEVTVAFEGTPIGNAILFDLDDVGALVRAIPEVTAITGRYYLEGEFAVSHRGRRAFFPVRATHPDHRVLERTQIVAGRFLNDWDVQQRRKVAVIGNIVAEHLFGSDTAIGETLIVDGVHYRVVGIFDDAGGEGERRMIYIPITTAQSVYAGGRRVHQIMFTLSDLPVDRSREIEQQARDLMARRHHFDPADPGAVQIDNLIEETARVRDVLDGLHAFTWLVGLGTVFAGAVGVGNIMLISVGERTREFGIRRAVGATSGSIVAMVLREAVLLTVLSGATGLLAGWATLHWLGPMLPEHELFGTPRVEPTSLFVAAGILVLSGVFAGVIPARRASRRPPAEALRG